MRKNITTKISQLLSFPNALIGNPMRVNNKWSPSLRWTPFVCILLGLIAMSQTAFAQYPSGKKLLDDIGGSGYLSELVNSVPTAANVVHYAKIVQRKKMLRDLIEAAHNITHLSYQETEEIEKLLDQAEKNIFSVSQRSLKQFFTPIKPALEEAFDRIDNLHKHEGGTLRGTSTGFKDLG